MVGGYGKNSFTTRCDLEKPPRFLQVHLTIGARCFFNLGTIGFKIDGVDFVPGVHTCLYILPLDSNTSPIL